MSDPGRGLQKHSKSYIQAKNHGFGNPSAARPKPPSEELTDYIDEIALDNKEVMAAMALQTLQDGMRAREIKQRLDAAKAYLSNFHHPSKRFEMDVNEQVNITAETRDAADRLTPGERLIMQRFEAEILDQRNAAEVEVEVEAAEVVEVVDVEIIKETGPESLQLPPLPEIGGV